MGGFTIYQILWYFLLYSVLGWALEVAFHGVTQGKVINRGFLNGPVCPVYGFGMLLVLLFFGKGIQGAEEISTGWLFLWGMILATVVELIGGWALDALFHARWWDYRDKPFNFRGYICLEFSIIWGLGICFVVKEVHPALSGAALGLVPERIGWVILALSYAGYFTDVVVTVLTVRGFNQKLEDLDRLRASLRIVSDSMSEVIGTTAITTAQKVEAGQVQAALLRAEFRDAAQETREELADSVREARERAAQSVQSLKESATQSVQTMKEAAALGVQSVKSSAAQSVQNARQTAAQSVQTAKETAAMSVQSVKSAAAQGVQTAKETAALGVQSAKSAAAFGMQGAKGAAAQSRKLLTAMRDILRGKGSFGIRRLLLAFPELTHRDYEESLKELQKLLELENAGLLREDGEETEPEPAPAENTEEKDGKE